MCLLFDCIFISGAREGRTTTKERDQDKSGPMVVMEGGCVPNATTAAALGGGAGGGGVDQGLAQHHRSWYEQHTASTSSSAAATTSPDELADAYFKGQHNYFSQVQGAYQGEHLCVL